MVLENLSVINFKNIRSASLRFSAKLNCLIGSNGEGKTNLLDAIYYLSFCKSAFNSVDSQSITHDADYFVLQGDYAHDDGEGHEQIYCSLAQRRRSSVIKNRISVSQNI